MRYYGIAFALALFAGVLATAADPDPEDVVFSELMYNPGQGPTVDPENEALEYIELCNRGDVAIDLSNWYFSNGVLYTFPEGVIIMPGSYLVVAKDPERIQQEYGITGVLGPFMLRLDDGGEEVTLKLPPVPPALEGLTAENFRYDDEPPWPTRADGTGASLERINLYWSNDRPGNWEASSAGGWFRFETSGNATSSRVYIYMNGAGEALVDDLEIKPAGGGANTLENGDFEDPTIDPWDATGNHSASSLEVTGAHSGAQCARIVATGAGGSSGNSLNCYTTTPLTEEEPYVVSGWVKFVSETTSITLRLSESTSTTGIYTEIEGGRGTPGNQNSVYSLDAPPSIENPRVVGWPGDPGDPEDLGTPGDPNHRTFVFHDPPMPTPADVVTFAVLVRDDHDAIVEVLLHWDDGGGENTQALADDGAHGDGYAGDGVYGGTLGPRSHMTVVKYWLTARDGAGNVRRFPRDGQYSRFSGYMVHPADPATELPVHYVFITPSDFSWLNSHVHEDTMVPATVVYNGEVWDNAQARYRGHTARGFDKHHWKFKFVKDHRFAGYPEELLDVFDRVPNNRGLLGDKLRTINLNSSWGDKTYMREYLAYEQFRLAGLTVVPGDPGEEDQVFPGIGNYVTWVVMYVNGSYWGLYTYVEQSNEDFLNRNGLDEHGGLFKGYSGAQGGTGGLVQKTGPVPEAIGELGTYVNRMNSLSGQSMTGYIDENMNVQDFLSYLVANSAIHNADQCGKNYYVYQDYYGLQRRWYMLPWDMDLTMGRNFEVCPPCGGIWNDYIRWDYWNHPLIICTQQYPKNDGPWNGIINGFLARTQDFLPIFYERLGSHMDNYFREEDLLAEIEFLREKLRSDAAADRVRWPDDCYPAYGSRDFDPHVEELERFVTNRIPTIRNALADLEAPPIQNLQCVRDDPSDTVELTWTIPGRSYDAIRVYRDDAIVATLSGDATGATVDLPGGQDHYIFRVASVWRGFERDGVSCLVTVGGGEWITMIDEDFSPAPTATWQLNGSAGFTNGELQAVPPAGSLVGTAFFKTKIPSESFRAYFDFRIDGSPAGADGLTFMWIRNSSPVGVIGAAGHQLGFWNGNVTGYCVEFDTWVNTELGDPNENHVGLNDTRSSGLRSLATTPVSTPFEGTGTFHVEVVCQNGFVTVSLANPSQGYGPELVINDSIPNYIAGQAYFGFSAATGGAVGDHRIDNFTLEIPGAGPEPPDPDFTAAPRTGQAPLTVIFTNATAGQVDSFTWSFGDGLGSQVENPVHTYTAPGNFTVRLTATGPGGSATEAKTDYIVADPSNSPNADFWATPTSGLAPLHVQFFSAITGGDATTYAWDFGDGEVSDTEHTEHTYLQPGAYTVRLTVTGPGGSDTAEKPDYIEVEAPLVPDVRFTANPTSEKRLLSCPFRMKPRDWSRVGSGIRRRCHGKR